MPQTEKPIVVSQPLKHSKNTQDRVLFSDIPPGYTITDRANASDFTNAEEIFTANPDAKTLAILYRNDVDAQGVDMWVPRSVYQSPATFDSDAHNYPENNHEHFYHVSGEKLVDLVLEVGCDVCAYGQANVMIPSGASMEEVREMAASRVSDISRWDDPFSFQEDWSTAEGFRISRVVEVVNGPDGNTANNITYDIPVEFNASKFGVDVFEMLKAVERGASMPPEVFMFAAARQAQEAGESFDSKLIGGLRDRAIAASVSAVYEHMNNNVPLAHPMIVVDPHGDVRQYDAGSVLRGSPAFPNDDDLILSAEPMENHSESAGRNHLDPSES